MRSGKVNEEILEAIKKCSDDECIQNFLIEMIYEETENPEHFKEQYIRSINKFRKQSK